jgi:phage shock protein A
MSTFSRLRYVIAANVNALIEKAEDPEKLLRALIREMEDASEEARVACAELLAEQQRLVRAEKQLTEDAAQWQERAEHAVEKGRDDLARDALKTRAEIETRHEATVDEQNRIAERVRQMEQDMSTLKDKLAEAKTKLKDLQMPAATRRTPGGVPEPTTVGERKIRRAMQRFDHLQAQVENLEARVRSYDVGGATASVWQEADTGQADPAIEAELDQLKSRLAQDHPSQGPETPRQPEESPA